MEIFHLMSVGRAMGRIDASAIPLGLAFYGMVPLMRWCITPNMSSKFCEKNQSFDIILKHPKMMTWCFNYILLTSKYFPMIHVATATIQNMICIKIYKENRVFAIYHKLGEISLVVFITCFAVHCFSSVHCTQCIVQKMHSRKPSFVITPAVFS